MSHTHIPRRTRKREVVRSGIANALYSGENDMYWLIGKRPHPETKQDLWYYEYFQIEVNPKHNFDKELVVKTVEAISEEAFLEYYEQKKQL